MKQALIIFTILMLQPMLSYANSTYTGKILEIHKGLGLSNVMFLILENNPTDKASCSIHSDYDYTFDVSTDDGKALMSMVLAAYIASRDVSIGGEGVCALHNSTEDLRYLRLK